MLAGYMTVTETAEKWNINRRTVQIMCNDGRIEGVERFGKFWAIPVDAERPKDHRITSGQYKDWRNKSSQKSNDNSSEV